MVSPTRRREAVQQVRREVKASERRACKVLGQSRSTQRYRPREPNRDQPLVKRMLAIVRQHPRYGYRRVWALLRDGGWSVNHKRVYRFIDVARSITATDVIESLRYLFAIRGAPTFIRSDNGPEFIARAIREWLAESGVETLFIAPGSPWENAYGESFNSRFRDELLNRELFTSLAEAGVITEDYRLAYNHQRPHSSLDYQTPAAFAAAVRGGSAPTPPASSPPENGLAPDAELFVNETQTLIATGT